MHALSDATRAIDGASGAGIRASVRAPLLVSVVLLFGVSGGLLWLLGYNYDGLTGGAATKIHPSTYVIVATFAWASISGGSPVGYGVRAARMRPGAFLLFVALVVLFVHIVSHKAPGMAGTLDTFLAPSLLVVLLIDVDERFMRRVEFIIHALMTANAVMALSEFVLRTRFFPYRFDGQSFEWDTRSTALHGHPLANAVITAWYCLALLNGCRSLPQGLKMPLIALQFAALVTFGGRTAFVVTLALGLLCAAGKVHNTLRSGRIPILWAAGAAVVLALVPVAIGGLAGGGFFDALLDRFSSDGGSANARVQMFAMFDNLSFRDLLIGPDAGLIEYLRRVNGLEWGIENPIINDILYQGLMITGLMIVAVTLYLTEIARLCGRGVWVQMAAFTILINTSESIASKTTMLSQFVVLVLCLYRPAALRGAPASPERFAPVSRSPRQISRATT